MRLLLVLSDPGRQAALSRAAQARGLAVTCAESGLHALTQLERASPDAVLYDLQVGDLSAQELHEILRSEASTRAVPQLLLAAAPAPDWFGGPADRLISPHATPAEVLAALLAPNVPSSLDLPSPPNVPSSPAQMHGTLEIVNLFDLIVSLTQLRKTGQIVVNVGPWQAQVVLLQGEVRHATYAGLKGEAALLRAFSETDVAPTSTFTFEVVAAEVAARLPETVTTYTSRLLLDIAVHLDHVRAERAGVPSPPADPSQPEARPKEPQC